jgi:hypothetical protein
VGGGGEVADPKVQICRFSTPSTPTLQHLCLNFLLLKMIAALCLLSREHIEVKLSAAVVLRGVSKVFPKSK